MFGPVTLAAAQPSPDATLLALGRELEAAWTHERAVDAAEAGQMTDESDARFDAAVVATEAVVDRIAAEVATSLPGLLVKARAAAWCFSGEPIDLLGEDTATILADSIVRDLIRIDRRRAA